MKRLLHTLLFGGSILWLSMMAVRGLPVSAIADDRMQKDGDLYHIDAQIILPGELDTLALSERQLEYAGQVDLEFAAKALLTPEEYGRLLFKEVNYTDYERGGTTYTAQNATIEKDNAIKAEIFSYDGFFSYYRSLPDDVLQIDWTEGWGIYTPDNEAKNCALSAQQAKALADEAIHSLQLPFDTQWLITRAYSPTETTYLNKGYYELVYQQLIDGVPVAVNNQKLFRTSNDRSKFYPHEIYGVIVKVFDTGIHSITCYWATAKDFPDDRTVNLSVQEAVELFSQYFDKNKSLDIAPVPLTVDRIALEYAVCENSDGLLVLTPSWSFLHMGKKQAFYGLRLSAVDGAVLLFNGWTI